jgi:hypothetical protein
MSAYTLPKGYLSPSQVWQYLTCPACYQHMYVERVPIPVSADLLIGRYAHVAANAMRLRVMEAAPVPFSEFVQAGSSVFEEAMDLAADEFNHILEDKTIVDEDSGEPLPIEVELTKKYESLEEAKDVACNVTRVALPKMAAYDAEAGLEAVEQWVWGLGPPRRDRTNAGPDEHAWMADDEEQAAWYEANPDVEPVFPFPIKARLDVMYRNGVKKDLKTATRNGAPDALARIQLVTYDLPWYAMGEPQKLGFDVAVKTKAPDFNVYWLNGTGEVTPEQYEYVKATVLRVAGDISAGRFPVNEAALWHKYEHGLPGCERAATWPGMA